MFVFAYGVGAYVVFVLTAVYAVGFVENGILGRTLDAAPVIESDARRAALANVLLFGLFALQHAYMGRPMFRRAWRSLLPPSMERSTHVLVSSLFLALVFLRWEPIPFELWSLGLHPLGFVLELLSYAGWLVTLVATFEIDHFALFGLQQASLHVHVKHVEPPRFQVPYLYRWVRHPIYFGLLLAVWSAPRMTVGHLLFAGLVTAYVVVLARMEERDLAYAHPEYSGYQARVPMLLPRTRPLRLRKRAG